MTTRHIQAGIIIQAWLHSNIESRGYERNDELHIDRIDPKWKARESWLQGGLDSFRTAVPIRNEIAPATAFSIVIAFTLTAGKKAHDCNFHTPAEIEAELSSPSPSLYLFQKGSEPWMETTLRGQHPSADNIVVKNLGLDAFPGLTEATGCYYIEFKQVEFDEYSRSIFVAA